MVQWDARGTLQAAWPEQVWRRVSHGAQEPAQCVGQHILLDVQGAVLALVVRQKKYHSLRGGSVPRVSGFELLVVGVVSCFAAGRAQQLRGLRAEGFRFPSFASLG